MLKNLFFTWAESYFYRPSFLNSLISLLLFPFSLIYSLAVRLKVAFAKPKDYKIKIISVGNLTVGGSGKTPLCKAIFNKYSPNFKTFIILRGYKRKSRGLYLVCHNGVIQTDIEICGDEAMEYATTLNNANVIVSEERTKAIEYAKNLGANLIILDDGFSKFNIAKFDILLPPIPAPTFNLTLPSGAYRYPLSFYKFADFIPSADDIIKRSFIKNQSPKMFLLSAIAKPFRLKNEIEKCIGYKFFPDHYGFSKNEVLQIFQKSGATSLLVTQKDYVKLCEFGVPLSVIVLETLMSENFIFKIDDYLNFK